MMIFFFLLSLFATPFFVLGYLFPPKSNKRGFAVCALLILFALGFSLTVSKAQQNGYDVTIKFVQSN